MYPRGDCGRCWQATHHSVHPHHLGDVNIYAICVVTNPSSKSIIVWAQAQTSIFLINIDNQRLITTNN